MELTHYSGISFYIKNLEWGVKNDTKSSQQLTLPDVPYNTEDVDICGPTDTHQIL
jgi:hypothetical protein